MLLLEVQVKSSLAPAGAGTCVSAMGSQTNLSAIVLGCARASRALRMDFAWSKG